MRSVEAVISPQAHSLLKPSRLRRGWGAAWVSGGESRPSPGRSLDEDGGNQVGQQPASGQPGVVRPQRGKPTQALQPSECQLHLPAHVVQPDDFLRRRAGSRKRGQQHHEPGRLQRARIGLVTLATGLAVQLLVLLLGASGGLRAMIRRAVTAVVAAPMRTACSTTAGPFSGNAAIRSKRWPAGSNRLTERQPIRVMKSAPCVWAWGKALPPKVGEVEGA